MCARASRALQRDSGNGGGLEYRAPSPRGNLARRRRVAAAEHSFFSYLLPLFLFFGRRGGAAPRSSARSGARAGPDRAMDGEGGAAPLGCGDEALRRAPHATRGGRTRTSPILCCLGMVRGRIERAREIVFKRGAGPARAPSCPAHADRGGPPPPPVFSFFFCCFGGCPPNDARGPRRSARPGDSEPGPPLGSWRRRRGNKARAATDALRRLLVPGGAGPAPARDSGYLAAWMRHAASTATRRIRGACPGRCTELVTGRLWLAAQRKL